MCRSFKNQTDHNSNLTEYWLPCTNEMVTNNNGFLRSRASNSAATVMHLYMQLPLKTQYMYSLPTSLSSTVEYTITREKESNHLHLASIKVHSYCFPFCCLRYVIYRGHGCYAHQKR